MLLAFSLGSDHRYIAKVLVDCDETSWFSRDGTGERTVALKHMVWERPTAAKGPPEQACEPGLASAIKRYDSKRQRRHAEPFFILVDEADQLIEFARAAFGEPSSS
jgi:hypothetical protein